MEESTAAPAPGLAPALGAAQASTPSSAREQLYRTYFGRLITAAQVTADFASVFACYMAAYFFYVGPLKGSSPQSLIEFTTFSAAASLLYVLIIDRVGLYRREISLLNVKELRGIFYVGLYAAAAILSVSFYIRSVSLSRITLTTAILLAPIALYLQRQIFYRVHVLFHQRGWSRQRVLIFGAGNIGTHLAKRMFESPSLGFYPVGFLDDEASKHGQAVRWTGIGPKPGVRVLGGEEVLSKALELGVELVVIALPSASFERNQHLVEMCVAAGVQYAIVPNAYEKFIQNIELFEIGSIPLLRRRAHRVSFYYLAMKRLTDFVLAAFFITVLSPLYLLIATAIKVESEGPVIFKQKRVGLRGREFSFYKFRSMFTTAPKYERSPADPRDPRITRVGRWLRRTSLDELPQLFNVLRGDMSLVGPRPEMPFIVANYTPLERQRLEAKPGITGVWQISAVRGEPIHQNLEYDLFYLENRSLLLDLAIVIKTMLSVIRGIGAV
jgi:exopolysaccharide biosynthesis polyprenyl glycosylphosphotransferase